MIIYVYIVWLTVKTPAGCLYDGILGEVLQRAAELELGGMPQRPSGPAAWYPEVPVESSRNLNWITLW
jgi:hypothetical protein